MHGNGQSSIGELSARAYNALQFGADFTRRGVFRAALAEAIEAVIEQYVPPPGSLDRGVRSIFSATIVEEWLRTHGFPQAVQRRWIDVSDWPEWGGAEELYEISCGTELSLLVQLPIHRAGARQYIGRVVVTS
jgi:hypothetical protein